MEYKSKECIDCGGIFFYRNRMQVRCPSCQKIHNKEMSKEYARLNKSYKKSLLNITPENKRQISYDFIRKIPMDENYAKEQIKETLKIRDTILGELI